MLHADLTTRAVVTLVAMLIFGISGIFLIRLKIKDGLLHWLSYIVLIAVVALGIPFNTLLGYEHPENQNAITFYALYLLGSFSLLKYVDRRVDFWDKHRYEIVRQISPAEYLKKRKQAGLWIILAGFCVLMTAVCIVIAGFLFVHDDSLAVVSALGGISLIGALIIIKSCRLNEKPAQRYPGMENLDDWMELIGPAETYPLEGSDNAVAIAIAAELLKTAAIRVNTAYAVKAEMEILLGKKDMDSAYLLLQIENCREKIATEEALYERRWVLVVVRCKLLTGVMYTSPVIYRLRFV